MNSAFSWNDITFEWDELYKCYHSSDGFIKLYKSFKVSSKDKTKWDVWFGTLSVQIDSEDPSVAVSSAYEKVIHDLNDQIAKKLNALSVLYRYKRG